MADQKNKYTKKIRLGVWNYDEETRKFNADVETTYLGNLHLSIEMYDLAKETQGWGLIVGNIEVDGQQIPIRENDYNGNKRWAGTLSKDASDKGNARVNINKVLSANPIKEYELQICEKFQDNRDVEVKAKENDQPF